MSRATLNRVLLGLCGVLLLAGVGLLLGLRPHGQPVLTEAQRTRWRHESWWWAALLAAGWVLFVIGLMWLWTQLSPGRAGRVRLPLREHRRVQLHGRALADALRAEAARIPGVARARVRVLGTARTPRARFLLALDPGADPGAVLDRLAAGPIAHAHTTTGRPLPAEARLTLLAHPSTRVT